MSAAGEPPPGAAASPGAAPRRLRALDPRTYDWDHDALHARPCPICGAAGAPRFVRPDELVVELCSGCGTWFVSPVPDEEQLARFYSDYHGRHRVAPFETTAYRERLGQPSLADPAALAARIRARRPADDFRIQELGTLLALDGARVLDVGCGQGQLLWGLRELGAAVEGIDVDPQAVAFAREHLGLDGVRRGKLEELAPPGPFDLIALQDLLEHVLNPRELLERARRLLGPRGLLYLWTPDATFAGDEPEPLVFRADFEHVQFLQARTVGYLAQELELDVLHLEGVGFLGSREDVRPGRGVPAGAGERLRAALKRLPGFDRVNRLRLAVQGRDPLRSGRYHLFAVLRARGA